MVGVNLPRATYGQLWNFWLFLADASGTTVLGTVEPDSMIFCGTSAGKGIAFRWGLAGSGTDPNVMAGTVVTTKFTNTNTTLVSANKALISAPTGGMGQFKGLT